MKNGIKVEIKERRDRGRKCLGKKKNIERMRKMLKIRFVKMFPDTRNFKSVRNWERKREKKEKENKWDTKKVKKKIEGRERGRVINSEKSRWKEEKENPTLEVEKKFFNKSKKRRKMENFLVRINVSTKIYRKIKFKL